MKAILILAIFISSSMIGWSQAPSGFNYQAVIRNESGEIIANDLVSLRFTIKELTANGMSVYQETHASATSEFGLVNIIIGQGIVNSGVFSSINWGTNLYFMQVEVNIGNGFTNMGTQQLMSVPYSLSTLNAPNSWGTTGNNSINADVNFLGTNNNEDFIFKTNGLERMRILAGGDVGIGTDAPEYMGNGTYTVGTILHIQSEESQYPGLILSLNDVNEEIQNLGRLSLSPTSLDIMNSNTEGSVNVTLGSGVFSFPTMSISSDETIIQNVYGSSKLRVVSMDATNAAMVIQNETTGSGINDGGVLQNIGNSLYLSNLEDANIILGAGGFNTLYVNESDRVGINTSAPETQLHIMGGSDASTTSNGYLIIGGVTSSNIVMDNNEIMSRSNGGTSQLYINGEGGNVAIGQTTGPSWLLTVNGSAAKPGGGSWTTTSDERLKENIQPFETGLDDVMKVNTVTYHYTEKTGHDISVEHVGVIAQELQEIVPSMVSEKALALTDGTSGNYLTVDPSAFTYMLINAVQELKTENDKLREELLKQQKQIESLLQTSISK